MNCTHCGSEQPATNTFCGDCGHALAANAETGEPRNLLASFARRKLFFVLSTVGALIVAVLFVLRVMAHPEAALTLFAPLTGLLVAIGVANFLIFRCPKCGAHFVWLFGEGIGIWLFTNCPKCGIRLRK